MRARKRNKAKATTTAPRRNPWAISLTTLQHPPPPLILPHSVLLPPPWLRRRRPHPRWPQVCAAPWRPCACLPRRSSAQPPLPRVQVQVRRRSRTRAWRGGTRAARARLPRGPRPVRATVPPQVPPQAPPLRARSARRCPPPSSRGSGPQPTAARDLPIPADHLPRATGCRRTRTRPTIPTRAPPPPPPPLLLLRRCPRRPRVPPCRARHTAHRAHLFAAAPPPSTGCG